MTNKRKNITFRELSQLWLTDIRICVKESTYTRYHRYIYKYILPRIGDFPIQAVDSFCINRFTEQLLTVGGLRGGGLSPKTTTDVLCVLKSVLKFGRLNGYACPDTAGVRIPQRRQQNTTVLSRESRAILESLVLAGSDYTSLGILLSLFTGLRIGELCGLKWGDIDLQKKILCVRRTVERIADLDPDAPKLTKLIISEPKTANSFRTIPLPKFLVKILQPAALSPESYVLTGEATPVEPLTFYKRYRRFMHKNSLDGYTFHALRHTFATRCIEVGFDTKALSEILGHANISTTMAIYVHPSMEQKRLFMEKLTPKK